jgi:prepilin-type N-terminal cleavage/methylation domain-containing protein
MRTDSGFSQPGLRCRELGLRTSSPFRADRNAKIESRQAKTQSAKPRTSRRGFTLIELLVSISIIGILAGLALGGMYRANVSAKQLNSKTTVSKVTAQINEIWESYRTRKLPIDPRLVLQSSGSPPYTVQYANALTWFAYFSNIRSMAGIPTASDPINALPSTAAFGNNIQIAALRLAATRELMRLELPCRMSDITSSTSGSPSNAQPVQTLLIPQPMNSSGQPLANPGSLSEQYRQFFMTHATSFNVTNESAECLYMIIKFASQNELGQKSITDDPRLVGDTDGDGLPEIQDAFNAGTYTPPPVGSPYTQHNMPIAFVRWPAGFLSDLQPGPTLAQYSAANPSNDYAAARHDIYDPLSVDPRAFRIVPLVFSAGADRTYDIWEHNAYANISATQKLFAQNDPYYTDNFAPIFPLQSNVQDPLPGGQMAPATVWGPSNTPGTGGYNDNITNHLLSTNRE